MARTVLLILMAVLSFDTVASPGRFAPYEEWVAVEWSEVEDDEHYERSMELFGTLSFTDAEIDQMLASGDRGSLVAVFVSDDVIEPRWIEAFESAIESSPNDPVLAFVAAVVCLRDELKQTVSWCNQSVFERLLEVAPDSMLSHYLLAVYHFERQRYRRAMDLVASGNRAPEINGLNRLVFELLYTHARSHGFPEYIANRYAFVRFLVIEYMGPLFGMCEQLPELSAQRQEAVRVCFEMGKRIETRSNTLFVQAMGMAMQRKVLEAQGGSADELQALSERRSELELVVDEIKAIPTRYLSRDIDARFFREVVELGEPTAHQRMLERLQQRMVAEEVLEPNTQ